MSALAKERVASTQLGGIVYALFFFAIFGPFRFWSPMAADFKHTYECSDPPGMLLTERWGFWFVSEGANLVTDRG